jgi:hypothetical protein
VLLDVIGARDGLGSNVVIVDVREELITHVRGHPYTRRELEIPAASMHHAGIHWRQLEHLETWLLEDVTTDSRQWGSRVLLHRELRIEVRLLSMVCGLLWDGSAMVCALLFAGFVGTKH